MIFALTFKVVRHHGSQSYSSEHPECYIWPDSSTGSCKWPIYLCVAVLKNTTPGRITSRSWCRMIVIAPPPRPRSTAPFACVVVTYVKRVFFPSPTDSLVLPSISVSPSRPPPLPSVRETTYPCARAQISPFFLLHRVFFAL